MKKSKFMIVLIVLMASALILIGCRDEEAAQPELEFAIGQQATYEDGTYRGVFKDGGNDQVNVQFTLKNNIIEEGSTRYRHLWYGGTDYGDLEEGDALYGVVEQYDQVLEYLEGKDVRESLQALYEPGDVIDDIDGFSGATLRANKAVSALRDALNRGVYNY